MKTSITRGSRVRSCFHFVGRSCMVGISPIGLRKTRVIPRITLWRDNPGHSGARRQFSACIAGTVASSLPILFAVIKSLVASFQISSRLALSVLFF